MGWAAAIPIVIGVIKGMVDAGKPNGPPPPVTVTPQSKTDPNPAASIKLGMGPQTGMNDMMKTGLSAIQPSGGASDLVKGGLMTPQALATMGMSSGPPVDTSGAGGMPTEMSTAKRLMMRKGLMGAAPQSADEGYF